MFSMRGSTTGGFPWLLSLMADMSARRAKVVPSVSFQVRSAECERDVETKTLNIGGGEAPKATDETHDQISDETEGFFLFFSFLSCFEK